MGKSLLKSDLFFLLLLAAAKLVLHLLTNHNYGFHRDELAMLYDARHLAWGYAAYPPITPFLGHLELALFGPSLVGFRFLSALAQAIVMVLAGLIAKELGGSRRAQALAALGAGIGILTLIQGALFQYVAFDFLWVVLLAYFTLRLLKTDNPRWWIGMGITIGLGMMTRYTMAVHIVGLILAVLLTPARKYLKSPWLWAGAAIAFVIFLPNLIWQLQNGFISLEFQRVIHARDIAIGRASGFLPEQFLMPNPFMLPFWVGGLIFYLRDARYRALGYLSLLPVILFFLLQGRGYYPAPVYVSLIAAGMNMFDSKLSTLPHKSARRSLIQNSIFISLGLIIAGALTLPLAPINSPWWNLTAKVHDNFTEEIGWPDLTEQVAAVYHALPPEEQPRTAVLAGNYGEAGAFALYGTDYGLPSLISPANSFWFQGPPTEDLDIVIVVGYRQETAEAYFLSCKPAGHITNAYEIPNEEYGGEILLCKGLRYPWMEMWGKMQRFM
ncbi:MAG: glycosyltransferase family 39 protein [Anaerolineales bacterium]|nr:glycosyltransferase family 39 protein [Anaerolineales bacterium]